MEVPEKIYLQVCGDCKDNECKNCKFEDLEDNVTWCKDEIFDKDIEYTRTDVFIEKACEWLDKNWTSFVNYDDEDGVVYYGNLTDKFKDYMKGK